MNTIASVAIQSVIREPLRHVPNAVLGTAGVSVAPDWLAIAVGITSILTGLVIIYKTYREIRLLPDKKEKDNP